MTVQRSTVHKKKSVKVRRRRSSTALLVVDVINTFDFPGARSLHASALKVARRIDRLKKRLAKKGVPVIYVNDHFGDWRLEPKVLLRRCLSQNCRGRDVAQILYPAEQDYFIMKAKHSAFHATVLEDLLETLGTKKIILTGLAGNICVLFTAQDAYMRDFEVIVPSDCIASNTVIENRWALRHLKKVCGISTTASSRLNV